MPKIADHQSSETLKMMLIGDSTAGKSGALCSLAAAGYKLRVLDFDNGLDIVKSYLTNPKSIYVQKNPSCADNFDYITLTDKTKNIGGQMYYAKAEAYAKAMEMLYQWKDGDINYGSVYTWGPETILVIDSLTGMSQYALNQHLSLQVALQKERTGYESQRDINVTQNMLRKFLDMVKDKNLKCNVIVTAHITVANEMGDAPQKDDKGHRDPGQGYPSAIGRALSPHIPRYFNNTLVAKTIGVGTSAKHGLFTNSQLSAGNTIGAKSSNPLGVKAEYGIEWGLAEYFRDVKGSDAPKEDVSVVSIALLSPPTIEGTVNK